MSAYDLQIAYIEEFIEKAANESQRLGLEARLVKDELKQLKISIEAKHEHCLLEITPRIEQLETKMELYCSGTRKSNDLAWADLDLEKALLIDAKEVISRIETKIEETEEKM